MDFDTNEYPNTFVSRKLHERISEYIRMKFFDTNKYLRIAHLRIGYLVGNPEVGNPDPY